MAVLLEYWSLRSGTRRRAARGGGVQVGEAARVNQRMAHHRRRRELRVAAPRVGFAAAMARVRKEVKNTGECEAC